MRIRIDPHVLLCAVAARLSAGNVRPVLGIEEDEAAEIEKSCDDLPFALAEVR